MKKIILLFVLLLVVGAAGFFYRRSVHGQEKAIAPLALHGNVDIRTVRLAFARDGTVSTMHVEEGAVVKSGDLLATIDATSAEAELAEARARVAAQQAVVERLATGTRPQEIEQVRARLVSAETRLANATQTLERLRQTAESGASSRQRLDDAQAQFNVEQAAVNEAKQALDLAVIGPREEDKAQAKAELTAAEAHVRLLEKRLADHVLRAPSTGIVQSRLVEPGDYATPTRPAYTLALTTPKWVRAYVTESDLNRIRPGAKASVTVDSFSNQPVEGWIGYISAVAEFTPKTVETEELRTQLVYEVRVFVTDPANRLRLGSPATVVVEESGAASTQATNRTNIDTESR